jgi:hypothetical protein
MPGPDYPWATYLQGAIWQPRTPPPTIKAVILHARDLSTPAAIAQLRQDLRRAYHYLVTSAGHVLQMIPERGWAPHVGRTRRGAFPDHHTISICLDGLPHQPHWPTEQVAAVAAVLSITFSVRGQIPVRDAGNCCAPTGRIPTLDAWPWLDMAGRILRIDTPIDRIYSMMLDAQDPPLSILEVQ